MIRSSVQIWRAPLLLGVLTTIGLISALLGDGVWDLISSVALGAPVAVGAWHGLRPRRGERR